MPLGFPHSPPQVKNMPPQGKHVTMFSLLYDIFLILDLLLLLLQCELCVTVPVQQRLLKHEGTQLAGSLLRQDFYAHSPRPDVDNGDIISGPQKAIIINLFCI